MRPSRLARSTSSSARRPLADEMGNATSATSMPMSASSAASSTFCSGEKATPGICSPSRSVSSWRKIRCGQRSAGSSFRSPLAEPIAIEQNRASSASSAATAFGQVGSDRTYLRRSVDRLEVRGIDR
jgi:hypothetical protein